MVMVQQKYFSHTKIKTAKMNLIVTSNIYRVILFITAIVTLPFVIISLFVDIPFLISLIFSLIFFLILFMHANCVDISIEDNSIIHLTFWGQIINYKSINKIVVTAIKSDVYSNNAGGSFAFSYIEYLNKNNKKRIKFFYVPENNKGLIDKMKEIISQGKV